LTLISIFIPISLKVTLDFFKLFASVLITYDRDMWLFGDDGLDVSNLENVHHEDNSLQERDAKIVRSEESIENSPKDDSKVKDNGAIARSTGLLEELGQITHVLSDKTGTITKNEMIFTGCAVDGSLYGRKYMDENGSDFGGAYDSSVVYPLDSSIPIMSLLDDPYLESNISNLDERTLLFFKAIAICHTIQTFKKFLYYLRIFIFLYILK
jgi:magnesium-transporting ATPase (P-type)